MMRHSICVVPPSTNGEKNWIKIVHKKNREFARARMRFTRRAFSKEY
jgi:hypothetical protein